MAKTICREIAFKNFFIPVDIQKEDLSSIVCLWVRISLLSFLNHSNFHCYFLNRFLRASATFHMVGPTLPGRVQTRQSAMKNSVTLCSNGQLIHIVIFCVAQTASH